MSNGNLDEFNRAIGMLMQASNIQQQNEAREEKRLTNKYIALGSRIENASSLNELRNMKSLITNYSTETGLSGFEEYNLMPIYEQKTRTFQEADNAFIKAAGIQDELLGNQDELFANLTSLSEEEIVGKMNEMNNLLYHIEQGELNKYNPQNLAKGYTPKSLKNAVNRRLMNLTNASTVLQESEGTWQVFDPTTGELDHYTIDLMNDVKRNMLMGDVQSFKTNYKSMISNASTKFRYNQESYNNIANLLSGASAGNTVGDSGVDVNSDIIKFNNFDPSEVLLPEQISELKTMQGQYELAAKTYNNQHRLLTNDWYDEGELWKPEQIPGFNEDEGDKTLEELLREKEKNENLTPGSLKVEDYTMDSRGNLLLNEQEITNKAKLPDLLAELESQAGLNPGSLKVENYELIDGKAVLKKKDDSVKATTVVDTTDNNAISSDIKSGIQLDNEELDNQINNVPKDEEGGMWGETLTVVGLASAYGLSKTDKAQAFGKAMANAFLNQKEWLTSAMNLTNEQIDAFKSPKFKAMIERTTKNLETKQKSYDKAVDMFNKAKETLKDELKLRPKQLKNLSTTKAREVFDILKKAGIFKGDFISAKDVFYRWNQLANKPELISDKIKKVNPSMYLNMAKQLFNTKNPTKSQIEMIHRLWRFENQSKWNMIGLKRLLSRDFPELVKNFFTKNNMVNFTKSVASGYLQYEVGSEISDFVFDTAGYEPGLVGDVGGTIAATGFAKWLTGRFINNPAMIEKASRLINIVSPRMASSFMSAKGDARTKILMLTIGGILVAKDLFDYFSGRKSLDEIEEQIKLDEGVNKNLQEARRFKAAGGT